MFQGFFPPAWNFPYAKFSKAEALELQLLPIDGAQNRSRCALKNRSTQDQPTSTNVHVNQRSTNINQRKTQHVDTPKAFGCFQKLGIPHCWMVYKWKILYWNGIFWGYPYFRKTPTSSRTDEKIKEMWTSTTRCLLLEKIEPKQANLHYKLLGNGYLGGGFKSIFGSSPRKGFVDILGWQSFQVRPGWKQWKPL